MKHGLRSESRLLTPPGIGRYDFKFVLDPRFDYLSPRVRFDSGEYLTDVVMARMKDHLRPNLACPREAEVERRLCVTRETWKTRETTFEVPRSGSLGFCSENLLLVQPEQPYSNKGEQGSRGKFSELVHPHLACLLDGLREKGEEEVNIPLAGDGRVVTARHLRSQLLHDLLVDLHRSGLYDAVPKGHSSRNLLEWMLSPMYTASTPNGFDENTMWLVQECPEFKAWRSLARSQLTLLRISTHMFELYSPYWHDERTMLKVGFELGKLALSNGFYQEVEKMSRRLRRDHLDFSRKTAMIWHLKRMELHSKAHYLRPSQKEDHLERMFKFSELCHEAAALLANKIELGEIEKPPPSYRRNLMTAVLAGHRAVLRQKFSITISLLARSQNIIDMSYIKPTYLLKAQMDFESAIDDHERFLIGDTLARSNLADALRFLVDGEVDRARPFISDVRDWIEEVKGLIIKCRNQEWLEIDDFISTLPKHERPSEVQERRCGTFYYCLSKTTEVAYHLALSYLPESSSRSEIAEAKACIRHVFIRARESNIRHLRPVLSDLEITLNLRSLELDRVEMRKR